MVSTATRARRRFQPALEGLSMRIAPTVYTMPTIGIGMPSLPTSTTPLPSDPLAPRPPSAAEEIAAEIIGVDYGDGAIGCDQNCDYYEGYLESCTVVCD